MNIYSQKKRIMGNMNNYKVSINGVIVDLRVNQLFDCMQMRIKHKNGYELFEAGVDILTLDTGLPIVISTSGLWGCNILDFVRNYAYYKRINVENIEYILITEDVVEDRQNKRIEDKSLLPE